MNRLSGRDASPLATLVSYPKSGRTWLRYVFHLAAVDVHFTHAGSGTTSRYLGRRFSGVDRSELRGSRTIVMHRNPLDTAVSFYFQVHRKDLPRGSFRYYKRWIAYALTHRLPPHVMEDFVLHPGFGVAKICAFNRAWIDALYGDPGTLVLAYEEARRDPRTVFAELFEFLGVEVEDVAAVVEQSSFERMKSLESSGRHQHLMLGEGKQGDPESRKVRRGKIGGYRDYLSPEVIERCRQLAAEHGFDV